MGKTPFWVALLVSVKLSAATCVLPESLLQLGSPRLPDSDLFVRYNQEVESVKQSLSAHLTLKDKKKLISEQLQQFNRADLLFFLNSQSKVSLFFEANKKTGEDILKMMNSHPVVSDQALTKYGENTDEVGFCFGRATFVHLELLRQGLASEKIAKIFAIGGLFNEGVGWDYHVATAYQDSLGFWWVVDSLLPEVLGVQQWMDQISKWDGDKVHPRLRYYFTEAFKFQPQPGRYNQTTFNLPIYKGYFRDLLKWYQKPENCIKNK